MIFSEVGSYLIKLEFFVRVRVDLKLNHKNHLINLKKKYLIVNPLIVLQIKLPKKSIF